jgi:tRNA (guanine37-N1)-methyltransferase
MKFDVISIFPDFFSSITGSGLLKRALAEGKVEIRIHDLRGFTDDRHRTVDDRPFGGGPGMVFKPEPIFRAVEAIRAAAGEDAFPVILLSPQGSLLTQRRVEELARQRQIILICGRYEGVDERVAEYLATDELSIGDYVLSGGELAAAVVMECVTRLVPGVLGNAESAEQDSFASRWANAEEPHGERGLLDCPHYTRPADFRGIKVPEVLLSGHHEAVHRWRRQRSLEKTLHRRPELIERFPLSRHDREWLEGIQRATGRAAPR